MKDRRFPSATGQVVDDVEVERVRRLRKRLVRKQLERVVRRRAFDNRPRTSFEALVRERKMCRLNSKTRDVAVTGAVESVDVGGNIDDEADMDEEVTRGIEEGGERSGGRADMDTDEEVEVSGEEGGGLVKVNADDEVCMSANVRRNVEVTLPDGTLAVRVRKYIPSFFIREHH